jgi:hypothetical protein
MVAMSEGSAAGDPKQAAIGEAPSAAPGSPDAALDQTSSCESPSA